MPSVLFVCTANAGRSQMAQAIYNRLDKEGASSAGVCPWEELHPMAIKVMEEKDWPLCGHRPKSVQTMKDRYFDVVVTIGQQARNGLPKTLSSGRWMHWDIDDPADFDHTDQSYDAFCSARDRIEQNVRALIELPFMEKCGVFLRHSPGIASSFIGHDQKFDPCVMMPKIKNAGFSAMELTVYYDTPHFDPTDRLEVNALVKMSRALDLPVWSIHARDVGDLSSRDGTLRQKQMDEFKCCIELAQKTGAPFITSHAMIIGAKRPPEGDQNRLAESLDQLCTIVQKDSVRIAFENHSIRNDDISCERLLQMIGRYPKDAFGFVWDTGHSNTTGESAFIQQSAMDRLVSLHLNDNEGEGADSHMIPGDGTVDFPGVYRTLQREDYRGVYLYEVGPKALIGAPVELLLARVIERHDAFVKAAENEA